MKNRKMKLLSVNIFENRTLDGYDKINEVLMFQQLSHCWNPGWEF